MEIKSHHQGRTAELISDQIILASAEDGLDLLGDLYFQGFETIILYQKNIAPAFFDLRTRIAGEILQKFSNYRMRLKIVGDFNTVNSNSLRDFIYESNRGQLVHFVSSLEEALGSAVH